MELQKLPIRLLAIVWLLVGFSLDVAATGPRIKADLFSANANTIYAMDFPPFVTTDLANGGIALELARTALAAEKLEVPIVSQPLARMLKYYLFQEQALAVISLPLKLGAEQQQQLVFVPLLRLKKYYYVQSGKQPQGGSWDDNLQAFANRVYGADPEEDVEAYRKAGIRVENGKLITLLEKLKGGSIDFVAAAQPAVDWYLQRNFSEDQALFTRLEPMAAEETLFVIFNKRHPQGEKIAGQFKAGLAAMLSNGQYRMLLEKHLGGSEAVERYTLPLP